MLAHAVDQGLAGDAEEAGGPADIALVALQGLDQDLALQIVELEPLLEGGLFGLLGTDQTVEYEFRRLLGHSREPVRLAALIGVGLCHLYEGDPAGPYGVLLVEWTGLSDDLMGNPGGGRVTAEMVQTLIEAYGVSPEAAAPSE